MDESTEVMLSPGLAENFNDDLFSNFAPVTNNVQENVTVKTEDDQGMLLVDGLPCSSDSARFGADGVKTGCSKSSHISNEELRSPSIKSPSIKSPSIKPSPNKYTVSILKSPSSSPAKRPCSQPSSPAKRICRSPANDLFPGEIEEIPRVFIEPELLDLTDSKLDNVPAHVATLCDMFPEADPRYLWKQCEQLADETAYNELILSMLSTNDYPRVWVANANYNSPKPCASASSSKSETIIRASAAASTNIEASSSGLISSEVLSSCSASAVEGVTPPVASSSVEGITPLIASTSVEVTPPEQSSAEGPGASNVHTSGPADSCISRASTSTAGSEGSSDPGACRLDRCGSTNSELSTSLTAGLDSSDAQPSVRGADKVTASNVNTFTPMPQGSKSIEEQTQLQVLHENETVMDRELSTTSTVKASRESWQSGADLSHLKKVAQVKNLNGIGAGTSIAAALENLECLRYRDASSSATGSTSHADVKSTSMQSSSLTLEGTRSSSTAAMSSSTAVDVDMMEASTSGINVGNEEKTSQPSPPLSAKEGMVKKTVEKEDGAFRDASREPWQEQYEIFLQIFPDADPTYLEEKARVLSGNDEELRIFVGNALERKDYPTVYVADSQY